MVAALTLLICGILFTIGEFNNPFSGVVEIRPDAFREVLRSFGEIYINPPSESFGMGVIFALADVGDMNFAEFTFHALG
jgi:hypothetical protein